MKHLKSVMIALAIFVGATSFVNAQSKVAHIDTQLLVEAMPAMKAAQSELDKIQKTYDTEIKAMTKELQNKMTQYDQEAATKTDEENQKRFEEVQGMQTNIQKYTQQARQDLQKKQEDILKPILEKARQAIQKVGRAEGYEYVLDASTGGGILLADGKDLMPAVKKELGI